MKSEYFLNYNKRYILKNIGDSLTKNLLIFKYIGDSKSASTCNFEGQIMDFSQEAIYPIPEDEAMLLIL